MPHEQSLGGTVTGYQCSGHASCVYFDTLRTMAAPVLLHVLSFTIPGGVEFDEADTSMVIQTAEMVDLHARLTAADLAMLSRAIRASDVGGAPVTVRQSGAGLALEVGDTRAWDDTCREEVIAARAGYVSAVAAARAVLQASIAAAAIVEAQEVAAAEQRCAERRKG